MSKDNKGSGALGGTLALLLSVLAVAVGSVFFSALTHLGVSAWFAGGARWVSVTVGILVALVLPLVFDLWVSSRYRRVDPSAGNTLLTTLPTWNLLWLVAALGLMPVVSRRALEGSGGLLWPGAVADNPVARGAQAAARYIPRSEPASAEAASNLEPAAPAPGLKSASPGPSAETVASSQAEAPARDAVVAPPAPLQGGKLFDADQTPETLFTERADSVVLIVTRSAPPDVGPLALLLDELGVQVQTGSGSGFFVADDLIVTNHHVIDGAQSALVTLRNGATFGPVTILAKDAKHDLALLRAENLKAHPIPLLPAERQVAVGSAALAIGSPLGLEFSLTDGIVSAKRKLQGTDFLQMQTPIAPGSSGGPLLNRRGELIGVNTATKSANLNLAVDVRHVRDLLLAPRAPQQLQPFASGVRVTAVEVVGVEASSIDQMNYQEAAQSLAGTAERCVQGVPENASVTYRESGPAGDTALESNLDEASTQCLRDKGRLLRKLVGMFLATAYASELAAGKEVGLKLTLEGLPSGRSPQSADPARPLVLSFLVKK